MSFEIYARSVGEIRRYRFIKLLLGFSLVPLALISLAREGPSERSVAITSRPVVTTNDAMREDFPIRWAQGGKGRLKQIGKHAIFGRGPKNVLVILYEGEKTVTRAKTNARGDWKAQVWIKEAGVKAFRADFRRGGVASGRSMPLTATIVDASKRVASDVSITNIAPNDRVISGFFTLRGSAPPGDFVQIYIDATLLGRTEVDLAGRWSFKPSVKTGGRRTFTIVDEITERQFGPLPVFVVGSKPPAKKIVAN